MKIIQALIASAALLAVSPVHASSEIQAVTDGAAWTANMPNGRTGNLTLNPDGTGRMKAGIMSRNITWTAENGKLCLHGMPRQDRPNCMTAAAAQGGFQLTSDAGEVMSLTR